MKVTHRLAEVFGSQAEVARILDLDKASVSRWQNVPAKHHARLLAEAKRRKLRLTHADLIA